MGRCTVTPGVTDKVACNEKGLLWVVARGRRGVRVVVALGG
jgi:hypothetical protein